MKSCDYFIVGAGMAGSTIARLLTDLGYKCIVIDERMHIGGNCHSYKSNGIHVHRYGAHIFHTNDSRIWEFINRFGEFNSYRHKVFACSNNKMYSFPINMMTLYQLWGVVNPNQAKAKMEEVSLDIPQTNMESYCLSTIGEELYTMFIKNYTIKQWGRHPSSLPASVFKRLPVRFNYNNDYFDDKYQGIPIEGYENLFKKMLSGIEVILGCDYFSSNSQFSIKNKVIYTGMIDKFFNYKYGMLEYRSLDLKTTYLETDSYQGNSVVNYTDMSCKHTRVIEHKHFSLNNENKEGTFITIETPKEYKMGDIPFYPIGDANVNLYNKYKNNADEISKVIFVGRLAEYKYYDMHQIIGRAMKVVKEEHNNNMKGKLV